MKAGRVKVSRELLDHFEEKGEGFLWWIVTCDEIWVLHYDPENRRPYMEYLQSIKEIQNQSLCWKTHVYCILEF